MILNSGWHESWPPEPSKCLIIGYISWAMKGHDVRTDGGEKGVMVWWLLTDRCLAGGQMAADKRRGRERAEVSKLRHCLLLQAHIPPNRLLNPTRDVGSRCEQKMEEVSSRIPMQSCHFTLSAWIRGKKKLSSFLCRLWSVEQSYWWADGRGEGE